MSLRYTAPLSLPRLLPASPASALHAAPGACILVEPPGAERPMIRHASALLDTLVRISCPTGVVAQANERPPFLQRFFTPRCIGRSKRLAGTLCAEKTIPNFSPSKIVRPWSL